MFLRARLIISSIQTKWQKHKYVLTRQPAHSRGFPCLTRQLSSDVKADEIRRIAEQFLAMYIEPVFPNNVFMRKIFFYMCLLVLVYPLTTYWSCLEFVDVIFERVQFDVKQLWVLYVMQGYQV